jgi:hypothetical protein
MTSQVSTATRSAGCTVRQRYGRLVQSGLTQQEATSLIARADGIVRRLEGEEPPQATWRWQEIAGLEFLRFLVDTGRLRAGAHSEQDVLRDDLRQRVPALRGAAQRPPTGPSWHQRGAAHS